MKFIMAIFIVFLSLNQIHGIIIELTEQGYVVGEIMDISEDEIFLNKDDVMLIINKKIIRYIFEGPDRLEYKDLLSKDYKKLNLEEYDTLIFKEDNLNSEEISCHIQLKVKDGNVINSRYFIELENGKMILGKFEEKNPFLAKRYFLTNDEKKIKLENVKSYKNEDGYFHEVPDVFSSKAFAKRVAHGKIDLYSKKISTNVPGSFNGLSASGGGFSSLTTGSSFEYSVAYFKKDTDSLTIASYSNLKTALKDNQKSLELLKKHKTLSYIQGGLVIAGLGMVIAALTSVDEDEGITDGGILLAISGGIVINANWIPYFMKQGVIEDALEEYND